MYRIYQRPMNAVKKRKKITRVCRAHVYSADYPMHRTVKLSKWKSAYIHHTHIHGGGAERGREGGQ